MARLTINKFVARLREVLEKKTEISIVERPNYFGGAPCLRFSNEKHSFCPITLVAWANGEGYLDASSFLTAGINIGLTAADAKRIASAADGAARKTWNLRRRLLRATGLMD
jgi:hypothetical protein